MSPHQSISIVIPVFNSSDSLQLLLEKINAVVVANVYSAEIILVDDVSNAQTQIVLGAIEQLSWTNITISIIRLKEKQGQHKATLLGIKKANHDTIITIDDDLQFEPNSIPLLINKQKEENLDVVYATPHNKNNKPSLAIQILLFLAGSYKIIPYGGSSFRLINKRIVKQLLELGETNFVFIDALIFMVTKNIATINIALSPRLNGTSGYSFKSKVVLYLQIFLNYYPFVFLGVLLPAFFSISTLPFLFFIDFKNWITLVIISSVALFLFLKLINLLLPYRKTQTNDY